MSLYERARTELLWWSFFLPRQSVQWLAQRLPLAELRDRLPPVVGAKLRMGLYPARVTDAQAVAVEPRHPAWGEPPDLDLKRPIRYASPPRVSILMVTYGNLSLTRLCLASLQRAAGELPWELIIVDNHSPDQSVPWLKQIEAAAVLPMQMVANARNVGFAAANNQAARLARGDVLVFLNNDTVVTPGWLEHLQAHLDDPTIGLVGPVTNSCGNEAEVPIDYRDLDNMFDFAARYTGSHRDQLDDLPMLALYCAAMPRALFEAVGGLDEQYRIGMFEDDDLAMAVRRRGKRVVLARDVFVHHFGGAAFSRLPPSQYLRIWWENRRRFEQKWRARWQKR